MPMNPRRSSGIVQAADNDEGDIPDIWPCTHPNAVQQANSRAMWHFNISDDNAREARFNLFESIAPIDRQPCLQPKAFDRLLDHQARPT